MAMKAAVVIGVDRTGGLDPLNSAADGAKAVALWLEGEGYDVKCLTDHESKPVQGWKVYDAIANFATSPPRYSLLVVYFLGHGQWHTRADHWLLSGAPTDHLEAINLEGTMDNARYSGIPNVVFISDACRGIPELRSGAKVGGITLFPNHSDISQTSKVDVFRATSEARPAYEVAIAGRQQTILTYALRSAYKKPEPYMVREVIDGGTPIRVVPNRKLEDFIQNKVNDILEGIDITLAQDIEVNVPSDDDVYIARVQEKGRPPAPLTRHPDGGPPDTEMARATAKTPKTRIGRDAANAIVETLIGTKTKWWAGGKTQLKYISMEVEELKIRLPSDRPDRLESKVGFSVQGAEVVKVVTPKGEKNTFAELLKKGGSFDHPAIIQLWNVNSAVSVAIQLRDGKCAVLAGLDGYIGHASFDKVGLANVSYVPSSNHWLWAMYKKKKVKIDRLRALVALAAEYNNFQIHSDREAKALIKKIRMEKGIDPTLGLYAAHALSQAGKDNSVLSLRKVMHGDLKIDLFDIRALAFRHGHKDWAKYPVAPFCPMLTQTWNLLRPRGILLPPVLEEISPYLCNSLWTTFASEGTERIMEAVERGELP